MRKVYFFIFVLLPIWGLGYNYTTHKWLMEQALDILRNDGHTDCANLIESHHNISDVEWPDLDSTTNRKRAGNRTIKMTLTGDFAGEYSHNKLYVPFIGITGRIWIHKRIAARISGYNYFLLLICDSGLIVKLLSWDNLNLNMEAGYYIGLSPFAGGGGSFTLSIGIEKIVPFHYYSILSFAILETKVVFCSYREPLSLWVRIGLGANI